MSYDMYYCFSRVTYEYEGVDVETPLFWWSEGPSKGGEHRGVVAPSTVLREKTSGVRIMFPM